MGRIFVLSRRHSYTDFLIYSRRHSNSPHIQSRLHAAAVHQQAEENTNKKKREYLPTTNFANWVTNLGWTNGRTTTCSTKITGILLLLSMWPGGWRRRYRTGEVPGTYSGGWTLHLEYMLSAISGDRWMANSLMIANKLDPSIQQASQQHSSRPDDARCSSSFQLDWPNLW